MTYRNRAQGHEKQKCQRYRPDGTAPQLGTENTDTEHGQQMIEPQYRVIETIPETTIRMQLVC